MKSYYICFSSFFFFFLSSLTFLASDSSRLPVSVSFKASLFSQLKTTQATSLLIFFKVSLFLPSLGLQFHEQYFWVLHLQRHEAFFCMKMSWSIAQAGLWILNSLGKLQEIFQYLLNHSGTRQISFKDSLCFLWSITIVTF